MRGIRLYAMFAAMFMAGAFLASPELRAYAAPASHADIIAAINNAVSTIQSSITGAQNNINSNTNTAVSGLASQTSVNALQTTADGIKAKTDNLPTDPADQSLLDSQLAGIQADTDNIQTEISSLSIAGASPKSVLTSVLANPGDGDDEVFTLIPGSGNTFSGHITGQVTIPAGNGVNFNCVGPGVSVLFIQLGGGSTTILNEDFSCTALLAIVTDIGGGGDVGGVTLNLTTQYFESSDVTNVP